VKARRASEARAPVDARAALAAAIAKRKSLRADPERTAIRLVNGEGDGLPGLYVDQFDQVLLLQLEDPALLLSLLADLVASLDPLAIYVRPLDQDVRRRTKEEQRPARVHLRAGVEAAAAAAKLRSLDDPEVVVHEGLLRFVVRPRDGWSPGLFIDQRENRARAGEFVARRVREQGHCVVLNTFCYTCSFSVAAAKAGETSAVAVTSVDLSARYLDWGRRNFEANGLVPETQEFVQGDALTYLDIAAKKARRFDLLILDPPTFATSKRNGVFQVEREYASLFERAARIAAPGALILCSHNQKTFTRASLQTKLREGARAADRTIANLTPFQSPSDFPGADPVNPAARGFWVEVT